MNYRRLIKKCMDVSLYQKLLGLLGDYCDKCPSTGVEGMFDMLAERGKAILPKDKKALCILKHMTSPDELSANVMNKFLNLRFSDLPAEIKPMIKAGRKNETVFWACDGNISDKVKDLINWKGSAKTGHWSDVEGKKVQLIDVKDTNEV